jgi:hypothetical protein
MHRILFSPDIRCIPNNHERFKVEADEKIFNTGIIEMGELIPVIPYRYRYQIQVLVLIVSVPLP